MTVVRSRAPHQPMERDPELFRAALQCYASNPLFADTEEWVMGDNPYRRPVRPKALPYLDFTKPLRRDATCTYHALSAHRLLFNIYENDLLFLPAERFGAMQEDFARFYSEETKVLGDVLRPTLEAHVFGTWTVEALQARFLALPEAHEASPSRVMTAVRTSTNPQHAAVTLLIQLAGDFLSEASPMARNVLGNYGASLSELFKILIDEYGYGVHATKHSTLFEATLKSCGLLAQPHAYWQFYLTSALALNNYFHYVSKSHQRFFRYLGALYYAEATFSHTCRQIVHMLRDVFGSAVDTRYFAEHVHIDLYHGRMVFNKLILPVIARCGEAVIGEIVRGCEECQLLQEIADSDFIAQVAWSDAGEKYKALAQPVLASIAAGRITPRKQRFIEPRGELSVTHVHDGDELCHIVSGVMEFVTGHNRSVFLHAGEGTVIFRQRLHGAIIASEECVYDIYSIGDYTACLS